MSVMIVGQIKHFQCPLDCPLLSVAREHGGCPCSRKARLPREIPQCSNARQRILEGKIDRSSNPHDRFTSVYQASEHSRSIRSTLVTKVRGKGVGRWARPAI